MSNEAAPEKSTPPEEVKLAREQDERKKAIEKLNSRLAALHDAQKRYNDAKAQLGTAEAELQKVREGYRQARRQLDKLLPPVGDEDDGDPLRT